MKIWTDFMRNFVFDQYLDECTNTRTPLIQITVIAFKLRRKLKIIPFVRERTGQDTLV